VTAQKAQCTPSEKVRVLQRKLYRAAKAQPQRTFGVLFDKVCSLEVLASTVPVRAHCMRAVSPVHTAVLGFAPAFNSLLTMPALPLAQASMRGVAP